MKRLGREVAAIRDAHGEKQESFCERIGIARGTLSQIETGARGYSIKPLLTVLAGLSDNPIEKLLELSGTLNRMDPDLIRACTVIMEMHADPLRKDMAVRMVELLRDSKTGSQHREAK